VTNHLRLHRCPSCGRVCGGDWCCSSRAACWFPETASFATFAIAEQDRPYLRQPTGTPMWRGRFFLLTDTHTGAGGLLRLEEGQST
jgi:hypothetical protein